MRFDGIRMIFIAAICVALMLSCHKDPEMETSAIVQSEFIYDQASFPSAHASTIVETCGTIAAAWFGGTEEGNPDVGIWFSRFEDGRWSVPVEAADGKSCAVQTFLRSAPSFL